MSLQTTTVKEGCFKEKFVYWYKYSCKFNIKFNIFKHINVGIALTPSKSLIINVKYMEYVHKIRICIEKFVF